MDYRDIEWFALETNRDHSFFFEIASKYCISDAFVDHDGYSISSKGFLPISGPITSWEIDGETVERVGDFISLFIFLTPKSPPVVSAARKLKDAYSLEKKL